MRSLSVPYRNAPGAVHDQVKYLWISVNYVYTVAVIRIRQHFLKTPVARGQEGHQTDCQAGEPLYCIFFDHFRSEEHTSELQSLMRISYAVFCLKKKTTNK